MNCIKDTMQLEIELFLELCHVVGEEIPVFLCGMPSSLSEVAMTQVRERGQYTYMADMIQDEKGDLKEVCYDRVDIKNVTFDTHIIT